MMDAEELSYRIEKEGLDYCLHDIPPEDIADAAIASLWAQAVDLIEQLEDMLPDPYAFENDDEEGDDAA